MSDFDKLVYEDRELVRNRVAADIKKYKVWKKVRVVILIFIAFVFITSFIELFPVRLAYYLPYAEYYTIGGNLELAVNLIIKTVRNTTGIEYEFIGYEFLDLLAFFITMSLIPVFFIIKSKKGLPFKLDESRPIKQELYCKFLDFESTRQIYINKYKNDYAKYFEKNEQRGD